MKYQLNWARGKGLKTQTESSLLDWNQSNPITVCSPGNVGLAQPCVWVCYHTRYLAPGNRYQVPMEHTYDKPFDKLPVSETWFKYFGTRTLVLFSNDWLCSKARGSDALPVNALPCACIPAYNRLPYIPVDYRYVGLSVVKFWSQSFISVLNLVYQVPGNNQNVVYIPVRIIDWNVIMQCQSRATVYIHSTGKHCYTLPTFYHRLSISTCTRKWIIVYPSS